MRIIYLFGLFLSLSVKAQTILNSPENSSKEIKDPVSVILANGFHSSSHNGNTFVASIGNPKEENNSFINSDAGNSNPYGTIGSNTFHDTQGNIDVNSSGQLQFTLPIALPPGIKSVAPQINLIYTSGSSNGIAGYGFNLSGITAISRIGKNREKDGETKGIQLDYSDYYSFNGQRLILKSGEYGKDGAEYVTEKYSNVKIKSIGTITGKGPEYWEVIFEDGSQAWYGATRSEINNARTPIEYNIVKWRDTQGNYISYNYSQQNNVALISSIEWGGNEYLNKPHFNRIIFTYSQRQLIESSLINNITFIQDKILSSIQVHSNNSQFKKYVIHYDNHSNGLKYQFVKNITEYNANNEPANPITFEYEKNRNYSDKSIIEKGIKDIYTKKYGDFDHDGITDFIELETNGTISFKKSVYVQSDPINISYNSSDFSSYDFNKGTLITYRKNNTVGNNTGIVIPVKKYRNNSNTIYDYEFRIYSVNLDTRTLNFEYSKTLLFENFKSSVEPSEYDFNINCTINPSEITKLQSYDYNGDGISEIIANFSYRRTCHDGNEILPFSTNVKNTHDDIEHEHNHDISLHLPILQEDNTESYIQNGKENNTLLNINENKIASSNHEVAPIPVSHYEHKTMLFDLGQDVPYEHSFYVFNPDYNQYPKYFELADFNGDGIEELYFQENGRLTNFYNIYKNSDNNLYSLKSVIGDTYITGLSQNMLKADFNGDGKIDLAVPQADKASNWKFYLGNGKGFNSYDYNNFIYFSSGQEISDPGKHRNIIFEKHCSYSTITYYRYNAVDLDKDGKAEITVSKMIIGNHEWSSHSNLEGTIVDFKVYSNNQYHNSIGNTSLPLKFGLTKTTSHTFDRKVIYFSPLFINKTNQQIILIGRPEDCPDHNCNRLHTIYLDYHNIPTQSRLAFITQGNLKTSIEYKELDPTKNPNFYSSIKKEKFPYMEMDKLSNSFVVAQLRQEVSHNQIRKQDFRYRGFVTHLQGKGMIGFRHTARSSWYTDDLVSTKIWSGVEIDPIQEGIPIKEWTIKTNDENQIFPQNISENNTRLLSFKSTIYKTDKLLNGNIIHTDQLSQSDKTKIVTATVPIQSFTKDFQTNVSSTSTIEYGKYYLPTKTTTNINNGYSISESRLEYIHNINGIGKEYFVGRPRSKTEIIRAYGDTKGAKEDYVYENNLLKFTKTYNRDNSAWVQESYTYDGFGNIIQKILSNSTDTTTKTEKSQYEDKGIFVVKKTDNLGLETLISYNNWGQVLSQISPLGTTLTNTYDAWGKLLTSKTNLGGTTSYTYEKLFNGDAKVTEYQPDGNQNITFTNKIGQNYKTTTKSFGQGKWISKEVKFDGIGRKIAESEPYYDGQGATQWNTILYDEYSRPIKATAFTGKIVETKYTANTVTTTETNAHNRFKKQTFDALKNIISTEDKGGTIIFKYNAAGENIESKYDTNIVTTKYDTWGRKIEFHDPSNGTYRYEYNNGFGLLTKEISPKGEKQYFYNDKGQLISQREISNDGISTNKTISFSYNNKGLLTSKKGTSNGISFGSSVLYDSYGRVLSTSEENNGRYFTQKDLVYDDKNRLVSYEKSLYSNGKQTKVVIENIYDAWSGTLYQTKDKSTHKVLWELQETNAKGQVTLARLGATNIRNGYDTNGFLDFINHTSQKHPSMLYVSYSFNAIKNELNSRNTMGEWSILENFVYDDNNRLVNWTNPVNGKLHHNIYDKKGRIIENDQLGKIYFGNTNKIYQATSINLNDKGRENLNNNLIQYISYNENNDPIFINGVKGDVRFSYGLTEMRQMVTYGGNIQDKNNGQGKYTKYYSEDGSFEITIDHTTGKEKHILYLGNPYESDIIFVKNYNEEQGSYKFLHKDYLGSILAISDEAGNKVEQRHYDAWGNLTHLQFGKGEILTGSRLLTAVSRLLIDRGYTSHEHFFEVGIIHMNGRLYDPLLRRFLNADENIQDPHNTQNYNKYGYVYNNPLMYNDPSGEFAFIPILLAIGKAALIGAAVGLASYTIGLAVTGNLHQWNIGGALKATFWGAVGGAVSFGVGEIFNIASQAGKLTQIGTFLQKNIGDVGLAIVQAGTHAVSQATLSVMQGGSFEQAFWSGALGSLGASGWNKMFGTNGASMIAFGALSGGIGAELSGGNFWEGAVIGGVVAGLNHAMHKMGEDPPGKIKRKKLEKSIDVTDQILRSTEAIGVLEDYISELAKVAPNKNISKLGKSAGKLSSATSIGLSGLEYYNGSISGLELTFDLGTAVTSIWVSAKVGTMAGGPKGFLAGATVGGVSEFIIKPLYKGYIKPHVIRPAQKWYNIGWTSFQNEINAAILNAKMMKY